MANQTSHEILTPEEMAAADRRAIAEGPFDGYRLMQNAGEAVARLVLSRYGQAARYDVLAGPGNNGGDGYVVARLLQEAGAAVRVFALGAPRPGSDAALAARDCPVAAEDLKNYLPFDGSVVIDSLFGAGLDRPLDDAFASLFSSIEDKGLPVIAVDLPSGLNGLTGQSAGPVLAADLTVTFVRKKPGHLLYPGRQLCGELVVAEIGVHSEHIGSITLHENDPVNWLAELPFPQAEAHKYSRGHVAVFSGGPTSTGAARLAAMASARTGAGAVTVLSPLDALAVNAAHLTSIMLREAGSIEAAAAFIAERRPRAIVYGPGLDPSSATASFLVSLVNDVGRQISPLTVVVDASAITSAARDPAPLFAVARDSGVQMVLTPHDGEFARLFPDIAADRGISKVERARRAAKRSNCVVVYKGADTVIASPDGRAAINSNGSSWLATAGSGDVLAGIISGLTGQGMDAFEAACAAVWIHAEAGSQFGPGLIAEDLPGLVPSVLRRLLAPKTPI